MNLWMEIHKLSRLEHDLSDDEKKIEKLSPTKIL